MPDLGSPLWPLARAAADLLTATAAAPGPALPGTTGDGVTTADADAAAAPSLRPLAEVFDALPPLAPNWRRLVEFAAAYYQRGVGELALSVLPVSCA